MKPTEAPKTFAAILSHINHFLTIAIHLILDVRHCYPSESFLTARAYNFPVRQSRHPGVCAWINAAVAAVYIQLVKGTVARAVLAIAHPETCKVLEKYVFDMSRLPVVKREDWETPIIRDETPSEESSQLGLPVQAKDNPHAPGGARESELADLTEQLRGTLSAISTCSQKLKPVPEGCTFTIAIELKEDADPPVGHPQPWISVQPDQQRLKGGGSSRPDNSPDSDLYGVSQTDSPLEQRKARKAQDIPTSKTLPVRAVDAGEIGFEVWIEEGKTKNELTESDFATNAESSGRVFE